MGPCTFWAFPRCAIKALGGRGRRWQPLRQREKLGGKRECVEIPGVGGDAWWNREGWVWVFHDRHGASRRAPLPTSSTDAIRRRSRQSLDSNTPGDEETCRTYLRTAMFQLQGRTRAEERRLRGYDQHGVLVVEVRPNSKGRWRTTSCVYIHHFIF